MRPVKVAAMIVTAVMVAIAAVSSADPPTLFERQEALPFTLQAPLDELFRAREDGKVKGVLTVGDNQFDDVTVAARGHTSIMPGECSFPKLKVTLGHTTDAGPLAGIRTIKIGTHCGDAPGDELGTRYGRLKNDRSPIREAFVYRLLDLMRVPTFKARPARASYVFGPVRPPLVRAAMLLEDEDEAKRRLDVAEEIQPDAFTDADSAFTRDDLARLLFGEAMIGNFDWCLRMNQGDPYRCDDHKGLWNVLALRRADGTVVPLIYDFDLAGMVTGRHTWFPKIFNADFVASSSAAEVEVLSQLQRARSLLSRAELDAARRHFLERKMAALEALRDSGVDPDGAGAIRRYLDAFFNAIERDDAFYLPVVKVDGTRAYLDAAGAQPACGERSAVPVGTPVSPPLSTQGDMIQVRLLDVHWHWTEKNACAAVHDGGVWIDARSIDRRFPTR